MLSPRAMAHLGIGYGPRSIANLGIWLVALVVAAPEQGGHGKRQYENLDITRRRKSAREERELIEIMTALIRGGAL